jgi:hypothetical protein
MTRTAPLFGAQFTMYGEVTSLRGRPRVRPSQQSEGGR